MTEDNKKRNIADARRRADEALRAADALRGLGLHSEAVARAYYAAFYALRALLLTRGLEARTHAGAIHLLNVEFIRPGLFPASFNRLLGGMQRVRELADYDLAAVFTEAESTTAVDEASTFMRAVCDHLAREGYDK